jgi:hypothetical protein
MPRFPKRSLPSSFSNQNSTRISHILLFKNIMNNDLAVSASLLDEEEIHNKHKR